MKTWKISITAICIVLTTLALIYSLHDSEEESTLSASQNTTQELADSSSFLTGTVKNAQTGKPLNAMVTLQTPSQRDSIKTNDSGEYRLPMIADTCDVSVSSDGYVVRGRNDESIQITTSDDGDVVHNFELWPEAKATGRIVNDHFGVKATVVVNYNKDYSGAQNYEFATIETNDQGEFTLEQAYAGSVSFAISADGFPTQNLNEVILNFGETVDLGDIPLKTGTSIYGTITDISNGTPIRKASIVVSDDNDQIIAQIASTEEGTYRLPAICMPKATITISADGYHERKSIVKLEGQEKYQYNASLSKIAGIWVNINNNTGREPILSTLTITEIQSNKVLHEQEYINGSYSFSNMTDGPYLFTLVSHDKMAKAEQRAMGGDTVSLTLKPFARLNVQVTLKEQLKNKKANEPLRGTYRYKYTDLTGVETTTSWFDFSEDSFFIENLLPGTYTVEALAEKYIFDEGHVTKSAPIMLSDGETRFVKLVLTRGGTIRGRIHFPPGMINTPGSVHLIKRDGDSGYWHTETPYDINGEFILDELPNGNIHISIQTDDSLVLAYPNLNINENDDIMMEFNMQGARRTTDSGQSLEVPLLKKAMSSNKPFRMQEWIENVYTPWENAMIEQHNYQNSVVPVDHLNDNYEDSIQ